MNNRQLSEQAGLDEDVYTWNQIQLERFAELIRQDEREACVTECWVQMGLIPSQPWTINPYEQCIKAIRARGKE